MNWVTRLFNIRHGELPRLFFISAILVFSNFGSVWGQNVAYAAFITQSGLSVGQETLIWVLLLSSLVSIPALSIYTAFVDRVDNNRLFIYIVVAGGLIKFISIVLAELNLDTWAFPALYVLSVAWLAAWNAHFFTYVNDLFDIQSAKRTLPLILSAGRIGGILAGLTLPYFTNVLSLPKMDFVWIWFATDILVVGVLLTRPYLLKEKSTNTGSVSESRNTKQGNFSYLQSIKEGLKFTFSSKFLRWMAAGTILLAMLVTLLEYHTNGILAAEIDDYAGFLGKLDALSNALALVILFLVMGPMTKSWGIANTSLVYPLAIVFISGGLIGAGVLPAMASLLVGLASTTYLTRKGLRLNLQAPVESLLYNAVPIRIKGRSRAFVGGLMAPVGVIFGVMVLIFGVQLVPWAIIILALLYLTSTLAIRYQYTHALVEMLEEEDYTFLLEEEASEIVVADAATIQRLKEKLADSTSHETRVFMTQLIAQVGGTEALDVLIPFVQSAEEARTKAAMLNVISSAGIIGEKLREMYIGYLTDSDPQVRLAAISGLETLLGTKNPWLQNQLISMTEDKDSRVSYYSLQSLAGTGKFYSFDSAVAKLNGLLDSNSIDERKRAISILGGVSHPEAIGRLIELMDDADDQIRIEAAINIEKLAPPLGKALDGRILDVSRKLLSATAPRIRIAGVNVIGKYRSPENYSFLISMLGDENVQVRNSAVEVLVDIGKDAVPLLEEKLNSGGSQLRKGAGVVLGRINPRRFSSLVDESVSENLNNIYQNISLEQALAPYEHHRSVRVLLSAIRENNHEWIDEILYLLSAIHDSQALNIVGESLHSDLPETRNLALEVLESLTSPQTAALIASLFEPSYGPSQLLQLGGGSLQIKNMDTAQAFTSLMNMPGGIIPQLTLYAMGDIGWEINSQSNKDENSSKLAEAIEPIIQAAMQDPRQMTRETAQASLLKLRGEKITYAELGTVSIIERMIILKEVPFFRNISAIELKKMAEACKEKIFKKDAYIFKTDDVGGGLYIIVEGDVNIELEKRGSKSLLSTLGKDSYFGEMALFDKSPRSASAMANKDCVILELDPAPVKSLTMQSPDLALEFIYTLSQRIRDTSNRLAETTRSRPRELHKLYDQFN